MRESVGGMLVCDAHAGAVVEDVVLVFVGGRDG